MSSMDELYMAVRIAGRRGRSAKEKKQAMQASREVDARFRRRSPQRRQSPQRSQSPQRIRSSQRSQRPAEAESASESETLDEKDDPEESRPCDAVAVKKRRRSHGLVATEQLAVQVLEAKEAARDESGKPRRRWLQKFIASRVPATDNGEYQRQYDLARRLLKKETRESKEQPRSGALRGRTSTGYAETNVPHSKRKRKRGGGNKSLSAAVNDELWHWFVDTVQNVKGRIPSQVLLAQAELLGQDLRQQYAQRMREGTVDTSAAPKLPKFNYVWMLRWRQKYGVTWRTVDLFYKCSLLKLKTRLRVFWCNVFRIRWLHYFLFGPLAVLRWENCDQKPLWFNNIGALKTLGLRGAKRVAVKENVAATRMRFTMMTRCAWPKLRTQDSKRYAVMFKADGEDHSTLRRSLQMPPGVLLQFGPKGSYRLEHTLEFYDWLVPEAESEKECSVYLVDWFAPNLDEELDDLLENRGHACLRIPGCVTGQVQVPDTHLHGPFSGKVKKREMASNLLQLRRNPKKLPSTDRQTLVDRVEAAWQEVNHDRVSHGFVQVGIASDLFGAHDDDLTKDVLPFWKDLGMSEYRKAIGVEIQHEVQSGRLSSFSQYRDILENYPDHPPLKEGQEAFSWRIGDEDEGEDTPDEAELAAAEAEMESEPEALQEEDLDFGPTGAPAAPSSGAEALGSEAQAPGSEAKAPGECFEATVQSLLCDGKDLDAAERSVLKGLDAVRAAGGDQVTEELLLKRAMALRKQLASASDPAYQYLRTRHMERLQKQEQEVREQQARELDIKKLKADADIATANATKAKATGAALKTHLRAKMFEAKQRVADAQAAAAKETEDSQIRQKHYAGWLAENLKKYWKGHSSLRSDFEKKAGESTRSTHCAVPQFWKENLENFRDVAARPFAIEGRRGHMPPIYASEAFSWVLFGHHHQEDCKAGPDPEHAFRTLLCVVCPGYQKALGHRNSVASLIASSSRILDDAFLQGVWRYTHVMGGLKKFPEGLAQWPPDPSWLKKISPTATSARAMAFPATTPSAAASTAAPPDPTTGSAPKGSRSKNMMEPKGSLSEALMVKAAVGASKKTGAPPRSSPRILPASFKVLTIKKK